MFSRLSLCQRPPPPNRRAPIHVRRVRAQDAELAGPHRLEDVPTDDQCFPGFVQLPDDATPGEKAQSWWFL